MSSATTIHDGRGSLVNSALLCIILIVYMSIRHCSLCTCLFTLHSSHFLLMKVQKQLKLVQISRLRGPSETDLLNNSGIFL